MILRAVDWWQPTRRQFGYLDKNTAQTRFIWVSSASWFALKTKGANVVVLGIGYEVVGSKSARRQTIPFWETLTRWFTAKRRDKRTVFGYRTETGLSHG